MRGVRLTLGDLTLPLNFLVLSVAPFGVIIGLSTMEKLGAKLDTAHEVVSLRLADGNIATTVPLLKE